MASAIICLATNQKFNFSRYILLSLVNNIEAGVPLFMFLRFVQLLIGHQLGDMSHHKDIYNNPSLTKKVFTNMKRVGVGFFRVVTRLPSPSNDLLNGGKDSMKLTELMDLCTHLSNKVLELESKVIDIKSTYKEMIEKLEGRVDRLEEENKRIIADIDEDVEINLEEAHTKLYRIDLELPKKVLSMQDVDDEEPSDVEEVLKVVKEGYKRDGESLKMEITKKQKMDEEAEELRSHLQIVSSDNDDVYTKATLLASKIPIVDYKSHFERNKPYFKIIRAN
nr:hypothetical protein [Tanacetum cinerariifolium]